MADQAEQPRQIGAVLHGGIGRDGKGVKYSKISLPMVMASAPLPKSPTKVHRAGSFPTERSTLVAPALPLPMLRMSLRAANTLVNRMEKLMLPKKIGDDDSRQCLQTVIPEKDKISSIIALFPSPLKII